MAILSMPTSPKFRRVIFSLLGHTQQFAQGLSGSVKTKRLTAARWSAQYELPPMKRADAAAWCAFLVSCNGRAGRFYAGDPAATTARGNTTGSPKVITASGTTITSYNWTGTGVILYAGDYLAFGTPTSWRQLHKVTANVTATGGIAYDADFYGDGGYGYQEASITVAPHLRETPAEDEAIIVASPTCVMRLIDDEQAAWDISTAMVYGIRFSAEEVWS